MTTPEMLTEDEKVRIRAACGYLNVTDAYVMTLGIPASLQPQYLIEGAMQRVKVQALGYLRTQLGRYEATLAQMMENTENQAVTRIGDIDINKEEFAQLRDGPLAFWRSQICNALGVRVNPFAEGIGGPALNVPVL